MFKRLGSVAVLFLPLLAPAALVQSSQSVVLTKGWNAFYLTVAPTGTASQVFADWPVDYVAAYDQAAFQETRQYSGTDSTEGATAGGYRVWHRDDPGASSLNGIAANTVYVCFAKEAMAARLVYGRPMAPRVTWHASSPDASMNLVGISVSEPTALGEYFDGLDVGNTTYKQFYGTDPAAPKQAIFSPDKALPSGTVLVMDSSKVSDWSGVLHVSPVLGVDFGTNDTLSVVQVRNDGARARTVSLSLDTGSAARSGDLPPVPTGLQVKDVSTTLAAATNRWTAFTPAQPFAKRLEPGETLVLQLALDRTRLLGPEGTYYGGLLNVVDTDGGSHMKVQLPVEAIGDGCASAATAWPQGMWLATAELDTVTGFGRPRVETNRTETVTNIVDAATGRTVLVTNVHQEVTTSSPITEARAGGRMKVRLPLFVDRHGEMTMLQRFWYGRDAEGRLHVLSGSETSDVPLGHAKRVSTASLPTDFGKKTAVSGTFGTTATFTFTVDEKSPVNPMIHPFHPQHDGKGFDFKTPTPSGDVPENYQGRIKPESFSITNTVNFVWAESTGTAWNPDETLKGRLIWELGGVRHEGTLRASGPFVMKRISAATLEK